MCACSLCQQTSCGYKKDKISITLRYKIFAVGIGTDINEDQLYDITRDRSRVFFAETFEKLASMEFVRNVSKRICAKTGEFDQREYKYSRIRAS